MLGVLLRRQGWPVAYLGQNVPFQGLAKYIDTANPQAVVLVAMSEETARVLADWPIWIKQVLGNPIIAFGGRAFIVHPGLQAMPGIFLGDSIQEGFSNLIISIQQARN
jgi:hypothetical protein